MIIVCEGCGARFRMDHALFQDAKGARIRCRKCGGHIEVRHPEASLVPPAPDVPGAVRYEPAPTAIPAIREVVSKEGPVTAPVFSTEISFPHAPSSDAPVPPAKAEPEKEAPLPEEAVFSPSVPVADTAPFSSGDNSYDAGPHLAGVPAREPGGETSDALEESPTFQVDISIPVRPEPVSSREEHAAELDSLKRRLRASYRRGPSMLTIFLLVVPGILLLAGGSFLFRDTKPAQELLRKFFPPSGSGNTARAVEKPTYEIRDLNSSYAKTFIGGDLFVIEGTVANVGKGPSRGIRVQAALLGKDNQALVNNTVFAANLVDNTMLRHANRAVIEGFLGVRYGERNVNRDIPAGKSLPFMVVFFDPPGQIEYFTVKALDAE